MSAKKRGLGRGLDALLGSGSSGLTQPREVSVVPETKAEQPEQLVEREHSDGDMRHLPVEFLARGRYQPRRDMDPESLEELASSIRAQGIMQPIVVRPLEHERFEIIAGERRWRAAQLAELDQVPVIIRNVSDDAAIAMALIENIQRENLNPIEEAFALQRLQQEFELTQQQVADAVGKSRSAVANLLRMITLPDDVKKMLEHGDLEMGHARAILGLESQEQSSAARTVVAKGMSVRQTEAFVRKLQAPVEEKAEQAPQADVEFLQRKLTETLGAAVNISHNKKGKGKLVINYSSLEELDGILSHIQ
ncbi:ParB/RepB/Spo0J family partition protein [Oceanospirillum linum]|uniref:Probable chromosome-partitioning protein ParB n=1 Tax=Oceanospirillum linum TaxID=966 RepID=A0A1T1HBY9_OCELI|nr:ParB/RepB/Spo0J family partition protein [Oceanospirillum linum]OOV87359.1 chromosome partitioning protein ParB [Oceanospirillum linum]SEF82604.1 chromosome segregation DNA-binding protein [Oleiphilus messinensis]SMP19433.1 chromosome partitioning protein, ParB family [Oceanospirillum linum]